MATLKDINKVQRFDFNVYNTLLDEGNQLVAIIHYQRDLKSERAEIEYKINSETEMDKLGAYLMFMIPRVPDLSNTLVDFLHNRVNPVERLGLIEHFEDMGIDPYDWIARMRINEGKSHTDPLKVLVVDVDV